MDSQPSPKKRIAMYWAASCGGCDISLLEIGPRILELTAVADVVFWPCATDFKYRDVAGYPDRFIDICLFNGSVRTSEQEQIARLLRQKSAILIAYGSCATSGGIPALANLYEAEEIVADVYRDAGSTCNPQGVLPVPESPTEFGALEIPAFYDQVLTLGDVVPVDYQIPGCPPQADRVWEALQAILTGQAPPPGAGAVVGCNARSVCDECPREKRLVKIKEFHRPHEIRPEPEWCLLEQGLVCLGPATRGGCGALCVHASMPCRGCYGPSGQSRDQGAAMISALGSLLAAEDEETARTLVGQIADPTGTFYRFGLSAGSMKAGRADGAAAQPGERSHE